jgi:hypothetical protein
MVKIPSSPFGDSHEKMFRGLSAFSEPFGFHRVRHPDAGDGGLRVPGLLRLWRVQQRNLYLRRASESPLRLRAWLWL